MGNFINVPYSLAIRHQCFQAYLNASGNHLFENESTTGKGYQL